MKTFILTAVAVGLFITMPALADENCDVSTVEENGTPQCDLKAAASEQKTAGSQGGSSDAGSPKTGADLLNMIVDNEQEDTKLLDELSSQSQYPNKESLQQ